LRRYTKGSVLLEHLLVLVRMVGERVHGDLVVRDVFHDAALKVGEFLLTERVCLCNDGDNVDELAQLFHERDVELLETNLLYFRGKKKIRRKKNIRMARRLDHIQDSVDAGVQESRIALNARFLGQEVLILLNNVLFDLLVAVVTN